MKTLPMPELQRNPNGRPVVLTWFGGAHAFSGDYLTASGRVASLRRDGDVVRDARATDRLLTQAGELIAIPADDSGLYEADPACNHETAGAPGGGIKCKHCSGWFCY